MTKLIRCDAGHIFDRDVHQACPECDRLGIERESASSNVKSKPANDPTPKPIPKSKSGTQTAASLAFVIPTLWLAVAGGAAAMVAVGIGFVVLRSGNSTQRELMPEVAINKADFRNVSAPAPQPRPSRQQQQDILPSTGTGPAPETRQTQQTPAPGSGNTTQVLPAPQQQIPPAPNPQTSLITPGPAPQTSPGFGFDPTKISIDKVGPTRSGWGALYYSKKTRTWGESWGYGNQAQAKRRAFTECGGEQEECGFAASYRRSCGAIARASSGAWAGGIGDTVEEAARDAFNDCTRNGGNDCEIIRVNCAR